MSKRLHRFSKRKGLSEMVGAVFILVLIGVGSGFALTMFTAFTGYQNAVDTRAQYNAQFSREQLSYSSINLGGSQAYLPTETLPATLTSSNTTPSVFRPITNMNFTSNSNGWTFTKRYLQAGVVGMSGNFDPISSEGSSSGPGLIFTDFTVNTGSGSTVTAIGNWTSVFTLTSQQVQSLSSATSTSSITFRIGDNLPAADNYNAGSPSPVMEAFLLDASIHSKVIPITLAAPPTSGVWTTFDFTPNQAATKSFFTGSSGTYNFVLETQITLKRLNSGASEQRVYFDDTGIKLVLTNYQSATNCPVFQITQTPSSVQDLTISVTTAYNKSVTQTIYMWNYAQHIFVSVDSATVGVTSTTRAVDLGGSVGASQAQGYVQTSSSVFTPTGCSSVSTSPGTVIMKVGTVGVNGFHGSITGDTLTVYYTNTNQFSFTLVNKGSESVHLVSLWVSGSPGTLHMASTLSGGSHFDTWLAPGTSVTITVSYSWTPGQYTVELVSGRGNLFTETFSAS